MIRLLFIIVLSLGFFHVQAQGLKSDIGLNEGIDQSLYLSPVVHGDYTYIIYSEAVSNYRNYILKLDIDGNTIWKKPINIEISTEYSDIYAEIIQLFDFKVDEYGYFYLSGHANDGCDYMNENMIITVLLDENAEVVWQNIGFYDLNYSLSTSKLNITENEILFGVNLSQYAQPTQTNLLRLNRSTGAVLDSIPNYPVQSSYYFNSQADFSIIAIGEDQIYGISEDLEYVESVELNDSINSFIVKDDYIYLLSEEEMMVYDEHLNFIETIDFGVYNNLSDLKYINDQFNMLNKAEEGFTRIILDENFAIANQISFSPFEGFENENSYLVSYNNHHLSLAFNHNLHVFKSIRSINYSMTSQSDAPIKRVDAAIIGIELYDVSVTHAEGAPDEIVVQKAKGEILIENLGEYPITELKAYTNQGSWFCGPAAYFMPLTNLNILPGEQAWIDFGSIYYEVGSGNIVDEQFIANICVYISNPNGIVDLHKSNNKYCTEAVLGTVGLTKEELQNSNKKPIKIVDILGREIEKQPNVLMLYIYEDGSSEKVIIAE